MNELDKHLIKAGIFYKFNLIYCCKMPILLINNIYTYGQANCMLKNSIPPMAVWSQLSRNFANFSRFN